MKKKYFRPITKEVKAELPQIMAASGEDYNTGGDSPGTGGNDGPPSGGGMGAKGWLDPIDDENDDRE